MDGLRMRKAKMYRHWAGITRSGRKCLMIVLFFCLCPLMTVSTCYAKNYEIEQARSDSPVIKAYVTGEKASVDTDYSAEVTGADLEEKLSFHETEAVPFAKAGEGINYIVLLDNSSSVDPAQFAQAIRELAALRKGMSSKDAMSLYTVGANDSKGDGVKVVDSKGKKDASKDIRAIKKIKRDQSMTVLYRTLSRRLEEADNSKLRTIILLITDGEDDSLGKDNQPYQVKEEVKKARVPIYGIYLKNVISHPNLSRMRYTRRYVLEAGRGYYEHCHASSDSAGNVTKGFQNIQKILQKETTVVTLEEDDNSDRTTKDAALSLICDSDSVSLSKGQFQYQRNTDPDETGPKVTKYKKVSANVIRLTIEDDKTKHLAGAGEKENYTVWEKKGKKKGKVWEITKVTPASNGVDFDITFKNPLYSGKYEVTFGDITDLSDAKNKVEDQPYSFTFKGGFKSVLEHIKNFLKGFWWLFLLLVILVIGYIGIIILKKKKLMGGEFDVDGLTQSDTQLIRLSVTDAYGTVTDVTQNVEGSIFVGRSDINNLFYEDERLSRQHFVIEVTKMGCYVEDLETTNGTFVNGVRLTDRRKLANGDVIKAGKETFEFHTIQRGGDGNS